MKPILVTRVIPNKIVRGAQFISGSEINRRYIGISLVQIDEELQLLFWFRADMTFLCDRVSFKHLKTLQQRLNRLTLFACLQRSTPRRCIRNPFLVLQTLL